MENLNREIGKRLRQIRSVTNEGSKLSARQFAHLMNETADKILNYEVGRAAVSVQLLINLYYRGFNPVYILTGEGSMFADNEKGREFRSKLNKGEIRSDDRKNETESDSVDELIKKAQEYNVAAGDILKTIGKKKGL